MATTTAKSPPPGVIPTGPTPITSPDTLATIPDELILQMVISGLLGIHPRMIGRHPTYRALFHQGITKYKEQFCSLSANDIKTNINVYIPHDEVYPVPLRFSEQQALCSVLAFIHYKSRQKNNLVTPKDLFRSEYLEWRHSIYDPTKEIVKWSLPCDDLDPTFAQWRKTLKPEPKVYNKFIREEYFFIYREDFRGKLAWQGLLHTIDPTYNPKDPALYHMQCAWLMENVLKPNMLESYSKGLVRKWAASSNTSAFYTEWIQYFTNNVTTELLIGKLSTFITGSRMSISYKGPQKQYLTAWVNRAEMHNEIVPRGEGYSQAQLAQFLKNTVTGVNNLEQVWPIAITARRAAGNFTPLPYAEYKTRLFHAAEHFDTKNDRLKPLNINRVINKHEMDLDALQNVEDSDYPEPIDITGDTDDNDIIEVNYNEIPKNGSKFQNGKKKVNFGNRGNTSLRADVWNSLSKDTQKIWDQITNEDKNNILNYINNERFKKSNSNRNINIHEITDEDDIIEDDPKNSQDDDNSPSSDAEPRVVKMHKRVSSEEDDDDYPECPPPIHRRMINVSEVPATKFSNVKQTNKSSGTNEQALQEHREVLNPPTNFLDIMMSRNHMGDETSKEYVGTYPKNAITVHNNNKEQEKNGQNTANRKVTSATLQRSEFTPSSYGREVNMARRGTFVGSQNPHKSNNSNNRLSRLTQEDIMSMDQQTQAVLSSPNIDTQNISSDQSMMTFSSPTPMSVDQRRRSSGSYYSDGRWINNQYDQQGLNRDSNQYMDLDPTRPISEQLRENQHVLSHNDPHNNSYVPHNVHTSEHESEALTRLHGEEYVGNTNRSHIRSPTGNRDRDHQQHLQQAYNSSLDSSPIFSDANDFIREWQEGQRRLIKDEENQDDNDEPTSPPNVASLPRGMVPSPPSSTSTDKPSPSTLKVRPGKTTGLDTNTPDRPNKTIRLGNTTPSTSNKKKNNNNNNNKGPSFTPPNKLMNRVIVNNATGKHQVIPPTANNTPNLLPQDKTNDSPIVNTSRNHLDLQRNYQEALRKIQYLSDRIKKLEKTLANNDSLEWQATVEYLESKLKQWESSTNELEAKYIDLKNQSSNLESSYTKSQEEIEEKDKIIKEMRLKGKEQYDELTKLRHEHSMALKNQKEQITSSYQGKINEANTEVTRLTSLLELERSNTKNDMDEYFATYISKAKKEKIIDNVTLDPDTFNIAGQLRNAISHCTAIKAGDRIVIDDLVNRLAILADHNHGKLHDDNDNISTSDDYQHRTTIQEESSDGSSNNRNKIDSSAIASIIQEVKEHNDIVNQKCSSCSPKRQQR